MDNTTSGKGKHANDGVSKLGTKRIPLEQIMERLNERRRQSRYGEDRPGLTDARQPEQPRSGPGGSAYGHKGVRAGLFGEGNLAYWVFEPTDPFPRSAPLVIFLHGGGGGSPSRFGAWFDHLAKRGNLVVYPVYQESLRPWSKPWDQTAPTKLLTNVIVAVKDALTRLQIGGHVRPDLDRCAILGTSLGGALTAQIAAIATQKGIPLPKAIMPMVPGLGIWARRMLPSVDLRTIPSSLMMLVIVCADDKNAGDRGGRAIFSQTIRIPRQNKNLIVMHSDYHGTPPLVANHHSPAASNPVYGIGEKDLSPANAIHYYGYWKLFDALTDAAFYNKNRQYALGNTPEQRFMGTWSDGVAVKQLRVITDPKIAPPFQLVRLAGARRFLARRGQKNAPPK